MTTLPQSHTDLLQVSHIYLARDLQSDLYEETPGISGRFANLSGFIGRLGWKAQITDTMNFIVGTTL